MPIKQIRYFLIGIGVILLTGSGVRLYRLIRMHEEDHFFAPHLLLTSLSLLISWSVIKVGLSDQEMTRKQAISLIRSGSILLMVWGYRFYLLATSVQPASYLLAGMNMLMGTVVMCTGLKISRAIEGKERDGG